MRRGRHTRSMSTQFRAVIGLSAVVAAGALVLAVTVVPTTEQRREVQEAGQVGRDFDRELTRAIDALGPYVVERRPANRTDYQGLLDDVRQRLEAVPPVPVEGTTAYGREHSRDYREAAERRDLELEPFQAFAMWLSSSAVPRQEFLEAGVELVQINPGTLLSDFTITFSGEPLRTEVSSLPEGPQEVAPHQLGSRGRRAGARSGKVRRRRHRHDEGGRRRHRCRSWVRLRFRRQAGGLAPAARERAAIDCRGGLDPGRRARRLHRIVMPGPPMGREPVAPGEPHHRDTP